MTYPADVRLLTIFGLANVSVAQMKRVGRYRTGTVAESAVEHATEIAVIYPSWLGDYGGVPPSWTNQGQWGVPDNVVLGDSAVSFYAVKDGERQRLIENLRRFAPTLPPAVMQAGEYTK